MVLVNARFLQRPITGVERYAREITTRLGDRVRLARPRRPLHGVPGHLWEQLLLPRHVNGEVLWSPANSGPLAVTRQVVTIHDLAPLDHPESFQPGFAAWYRVLLPRLARRARCVMTVSCFSRARLAILAGVPEAAIVVAPGAPDSRFYPRSAAERAPLLARYGLDGPYIFTLGSLEPRKNLRRLLAAWEASRLAARGVRLAVAGRHWPSLRRATVRRDVAGLQLLGPVPDEDLPALYSGARAFVWPSLYEGFGLPVIEAMACGAPVITARGGATEEVAADAAVLVDPTDVEAIAHALHAVTQDDGLADHLRRAGLERAQAFSWQRSARVVWRTLEEAARD